MSRVAVLKGGRSLERQVSLRSGARVEDALERLGHDVIGIDVGARPRRAPARRARPTSRSSRCTAATARTAPSRSCSRSSGIPYTGSRRRRPASAAPTRSLAKHHMRDAGHPDAGLLRVQRDRLQGARRGGRAARDRGAPRRSRSSSSPPARARRWASSSRATAADVPGGAGRRVLLRRQGPARAPRRTAATSRSRVLDGEAAAGRRGGPARRGLLRLRGPLRDRRAPTFVCPAELPRRATARAQELALRTSRRCSAAAASRAST